MFQRQIAQRFIELEEDQEGFIIKHINKFIGRGVFSSRPFKKGDFLLEYSGEFISYQEGIRREKAYPIKFGSFIYFLNWNDKQYCIDATFSNRICKYVNDGIGQSQNCIMKLGVFNGRPHLCLYAKKNIAIGDELRYDYGVAGLPWRMKEKPKVAKNLGKSAEKPIRQPQEPRENESNDSKGCTRSSSRAKRKSFTQFRYLFPRVQVRSNSQCLVKDINKKSSSKGHKVHTSFKNCLPNDKKKNDTKQKGAKKRKVKAVLGNEELDIAKLKKVKKGVYCKDGKEGTNIAHNRKQMQTSVAGCQSIDTKSASLNNSETDFHGLKQKEKGYSSDNLLNQNISETEPHGSVTELPIENRHSSDNLLDQNMSESDPYESVTEPSITKENRTPSGNLLDQNISETDPHETVTEPSMRKEKRHSSDNLLDQNISETDTYELVTEPSMTKENGHSSENLLDQNIPETDPHESVTEPSMTKENGHSSEYPLDQNIPETDPHESVTEPSMPKENGHSSDNLLDQNISETNPYKSASEPPMPKEKRHLSDNLLDQNIPETDPHESDPDSSVSRETGHSSDCLHDQNSLERNAHEFIKDPTSYENTEKRSTHDAAYLRPCFVKLDRLSFEKHKVVMNLGRSAKNPIRQPHVQEPRGNDSNDSKGCTRSSSRAKRKSFTQFRYLFPRVQVRSNSQCLVKDMNKKSSSKGHKVHTSFKNCLPNDKKKNDTKQKGAKKRKVKAVLGNEELDIAKLKKVKKGVYCKDSKEGTNIAHNRKQIQTSVAGCQSIDTKSASLNNSETDLHGLKLKENGYSSDNLLDQNISETEPHGSVTEPSLPIENRHSSDNLLDKNMSESDPYESVPEPSITKENRNSSSNLLDQNISETDPHEMVTEPSLPIENRHSSDNFLHHNISETDPHETVTEPSMPKENGHSSDNLLDQNISENDPHEKVPEPSTLKENFHSSNNLLDQNISETDPNETVSETSIPKENGHLSNILLDQIMSEADPHESIPEPSMAKENGHSSDYLHDQNISETNTQEFVEDPTSFEKTEKHDAANLRPCFVVLDRLSVVQESRRKNKPDTKLNKFKSRAGDRKKAKPCRPCLFCGLKQSKLTRHLKLKHKHENRIKSVLRLPKPLQYQEFDQIKKEGILKANKEIMKNEKLSSKEVSDHLMRERRQGKCNLAVCSTCNGFYAANTIHKHKRSCMEAESTTQEPITIPVSLIADTGNVQFRDEVLSKFRKDEIGNLCRTDNFIKLFGFQTYVKIRSREEKKFELRDSIMSEMRRFAHLFLEFRSVAKGNKKTIISTIDMLARDNFTYLQEAITNVTTKDDGSIKSGLKAGIGFLLKKVAKVLKGQYLIQKEDEKAREVDNFLTVLQHFWTEIFSDAQYANVKARQTDLRKPKRLPDEEDIAKLRDFIMEEQKKLLDQYVMIANKEYQHLRDILVCRLTLFNARRGGEPSRLMLKEWKDAEDNVWVSDSAVQRIDDPIEKHLLGQYKIAYQAGKNMNQMVPLLIPNDCIKGLQILASEETRSSAGIHSKNIFLFPSTMSSKHHIKGWNAVDNVCKRAGIESRINATSVRHRASTLYAALEVPDKERELFYKHMGHSEEINRHVYQCPLAVQEVIKVGKFFQNLDRPLNSIAATINSEEATTNGEQIAEEVARMDQSTTDGKIYSTRSVKRKQPVTRPVDNRGTVDISDIDDSDDDEDYVNDEDTGEENDSSEEDEYCSDEEITFKTRRQRETDNLALKGNRIRWSGKDTNTVKDYFKSYIDDTSTSDRTGPLPGKLQVYEFLKKYPGVLGNADTVRKLYLVRTKIFNERNKTRRIVFKQLNHILK